MKINKTNAARLLDKAKITYELIPYEVDENDLSGTHVADPLGENVAQVFKTLVLHGDKSGYFVCVIPGADEVDLKKAAKVSGNKSCEMIPVKELLPLTGYLTQDPKQVDEMFRRMVFNVLTDNKDDHAKNFSFICKEGGWSLAPAYDLTRCSNGYNGEHATSVNNHGNPTIDDMLVVGESIRIPQKRGREMIQGIAEGCAEIISKDYISALK